MSLINEALRKARQAASEHDSKQAEGPFQPAKAYPSRRPGRRGGPLAMVLIAVIAGVVGAAAAWWVFGDRQETSQVAVDTDPGTETAATGVSVAGTSPAPAVLQSEEEATEASASDAPTPSSAEPVDRPAEVQPEVQPGVMESAAAEPADREGAVDLGERVFVMEADLGGTTLSLGFIVARPVNPFAEINGIEVYVGSKIEGFVVESIDADRIVLRDEAGPLVLRVP